jgi:hypothetical protein
MLDLATYLLLNPPCICWSLGNAILWWPHSFVCGIVHCPQQQDPISFPELFTAAANLNSAKFAISASSVSSSFRRFASSQSPEEPSGIPSEKWLARLVVFYTSSLKSRLHLRLFLSTTPSNILCYLSCACIVSLGSAAASKTRLLLRH